MKKNIIERIDYPMGGKKEDKKAFYSKLFEIEKQTARAESHYEDWYYKVEYTLTNGEQWNYYENQELGIPSRLEREAWDI